MAWTIRGRQNERERLEAMYRLMGDPELLELAAASKDLTAVAQAVLADEMKARDLRVPDVGAVQVPLVEDSEGDSGLKTLHVFSQTFEAQAAFRLLEREGIEFAVGDRTIDENGQPIAGPAVQLALMVDAADWDRSVTLLRKQAGLFPEAVVDPRGDTEESEQETFPVGEFEDAGELAAAEQVLRESGVWFRTVRHDDEEWKRTSVEVHAEDADRALTTLERLLEAEGE